MVPKKAGHFSGHGKFNRVGPLCAILAILAEPAPSAWGEMAVQIFDTGAESRIALAPEALGNRQQWFNLPEDRTEHRFKGDALIFNGKLAMALRRNGRGVEIYAAGPAGFLRAAELVATSKAPAGLLRSVKLLENTPSSVSLEATFGEEGGDPVSIRYELKVGQLFVQAQPGPGAIGLKILAPCRFAVMPDFFADDMVVDARDMAVDRTELPSENFLLHMLGQGEALLMAVWQPAQEDIGIELQGAGRSRTIIGSELKFSNNSKAWVAVLSGPGTWHQRDISLGDRGRILRLDWRVPYAAHWRVDWRREDQLTDSWEMLTQDPNGEYVKHGWYGQPESFGNNDWLKDGRERWTTVLGSFNYPCWVDQQGNGWLEPLRKGVWFLGPALIYPITRLENTPLDQFTIVDIMRSTLGVGPCEYILDVEGQKKTFQGRPTCASRTILNEIYSKKEQIQRKAEVLQTLDEVIAFVRHIRGRIEDYAAFGREMDSWLEQQKRLYPEVASRLTLLQKTTLRIEEHMVRRKNGIKTPEFATGLVEDFRANLVDNVADDAVVKCKRITAALVDIGGNQDELVGECRMVVKILRQRAAMAMAEDPRVGKAAREIRRRTHQMLRNPTSYEAPRH